MLSRFIRFNIGLGGSFRFMNMGVLEHREGGRERERERRRERERQREKERKEKGVGERDYYLV